MKSLPNDVLLAVILIGWNSQIIDANDRAKQLLAASDDELKKGICLVDLVKVENNHLCQWLDAGLSPQSDREREQYYLERLLLPLQGEPQTINLPINSIADAIDQNTINGVFVILENNCREKQA